MKKILKDIQDGTFAKDFLLDMSSAGGQVHFNAMRKLASEHPSEAVGADIASCTAGATRISSSTTDLNGICFKGIAIGEFSSMA